jgi:hypothetical protein
MGRNEIRLRRQKISSGRIAHHRNYGDVMARHERDIKIKRVLRVFLYFLIIAFVVMLFIMYQRWHQKSVNQKIKSAIEVVAKKATT